MPMNTISANFKPGVNHPNYLMRKGILEGMEKYAPALHGRLLDFGCGTMPYRSLFEHTQYTGVDYLAPGASTEGKVADFFYDGKTLPFENDSFDAVLSSEVFEHVFNLDDMLAELNRVLKPGGKMLFTCPFAFGEHEEPWDFARYTSFAIAALMERHGFRVVNYEKSGTSWDAITQLINVQYHRDVVEKVKHIPVVRTIFREIGYSFINISGMICSKILPSSQTLYMNNIVLAEKR